MKALDITHQRLRNSRLIGCTCKNAEDVVAWLCAMQSQDYAGAKWALAQRTTDATTSDVDRLFNEEKILRTHVLRPTWHLVAPADIRWMLDLTAPHVRRASPPSRTPTTASWWASTPVNRSRRAAISW